MRLYSDEELKQLPEFEDLDEALRQPENVFRFRAYRQDDADVLERVAELKNLQTLSISLSNVSKLLPRLGELTGLQDIYLQASKIQTFPKSVLGLAHLRSLAIGNNSLRELPASIGDLEALEYLGLSQNELRGLPESIGRLAKLKTLVLSYNQVEGVPESIGNLKALEFLGLDVNQLRQVPQEIANLQGLQSLRLNSNKLRTIPEAVCVLSHLRRLSLEHNPLESLPAGLSQMASLEELSIEAEKRSLFMDWSYQTSTLPPKIELSDLNLFVSPGSEFSRPAKAAIEESGLAEMEAMIFQKLREAVEIETTIPDDGSVPGISRLGGFPDLPEPSLFPKTDDLYWVFLAQLNLADLAPFNSCLPRSGLLSFFVDSTENFSGKVLFHEGDVRNLITVRHGGEDEMFSPQDDYSQKPHRVRFKRFCSFPYDPPEGLEGDAAFEAYADYEGFREDISHHINGHTFTQHESPQEQAANKLRGRPDEWVPLLQLGYDSDVGFCFWDAGTLTFCIHQEDLRRHDFSRVHVSLESS